MALSALLLALAVQAEPAAQSPLASLPRLRQEVRVELPPGTAFPAPEVTVVLSLEVGADGRVEKAALERGAGEPFDAAALEAARRMEFEPARLEGGEAVPVAISFALRIAQPPPPPPPERPRPVRFGGALLERGTRRPLAFVQVDARVGDQAVASAATDAAGRFLLEVPAAAFRLVAAPADHRRLDVPVEARPGEEREETFFLEAVPSGYVAVVRGERVRREVTRQVIPRDEVELVAGTQGDTLKAVANLPGVARPAFGGGQLVLRGSSPGDSAVFVEGLQIPALYHFGGLRSTFAPRFLDSLEFVPGNFSADYGRLTGGIVNVRVRDPARDLLRGEADFNLYDGGVAVEGPLSEHWSAGAAVRRSWVGDLLPLFLPRDAPLSFRTAPSFYDYQVLSTWAPDDRDRVRVLAFGSQDGLTALLTRPGEDPTISGNLEFRTGFHELMASWSRVLAPSLRQETSLALGLQETNAAVGPELFFDLRTERVDLRSTWSWQARAWLEARAGLDLQVAWYHIALDLPQPPQEGQPEPPASTRPRVVTTQSGSLWNPGAFAEMRLLPREDLALVPALRVDRASAIGRTSLDPRLAVRWSASAGTVIKAAAGVYQQPPDPAQSARDIGSPDLLFERSVQYSAGVERRLAKGLDLDASAFYKDLSRLVVRNQAAAVDPTAPPYVNRGRGRIYGLEVLLRARLGERFFGWIAYTYQRSLRTDAPGLPERRFDQDQPHILTALGTWRASARWAFGARFRLVSGNPYTPVTGSVYDAGSDVYVPTFGGTNTGRLGTFAALDLRVDRTWTWDRWRLSAYLDVQNVANRGNQEGWQYSFDYRQRTPLTGLPVLPILGVKGEW